MVEDRSLIGGHVYVSFPPIDLYAFNEMRLNSPFLIQFINYWCAFYMDKDNYDNTAVNAQFFAFFISHIYHVSLLSQRNSLV